MRDRIAGLEMTKLAAKSRRGVATNKGEATECRGMSTIIHSFIHSFICY